MLDDFTNQVIAELAKQVPVKQTYDDLASPAAKQSGQILEDITKVLHLALAPVQFTAALQDRFRGFLNSSVRRVPEDRRVSPPPQILGPVIEAIRYEPEGTPIDQMFSHLLSSAIDKDRVSIAHPSFPGIIRQLSTDEAIIIDKLSCAVYKRISTFKYDYMQNKFVGERIIEVDDFPKGELFFSQNLDLYIDHLYALGIACLSETGPQEVIMGEDLRYLGTGKKIQTGTRRFQEYQLTSWGKAFSEACSLAEGA